MVELPTYHTKEPQPSNNTIALAKLLTAVQNLINGALQKSGGTVTGQVNFQRADGGILEFTTPLSEVNLGTHPTTGAMTIENTGSGTESDAVKLISGTKLITQLLDTTQTGGRFLLTQGKIGSPKNGELCWDVIEDNVELYIYVSGEGAWFTLASIAT